MRVAVLWRLLAALACLAAAAPGAAGLHAAPATDGYPPGPEGSPTSFQARAPLPEPLQEVQAAAHGQFVYVAGGINSDRQASYSVYRYDTSVDAWEAMPRLPAALHHAPIVADEEGGIYVLGGLTGGFAAVDTCYYLAPGAASWEILPPLPAPRGAAVAGHFPGADGGTLVVAGGVNSEGKVAEVAIYRLGARQWESGAAMPTPREHCGGAVVGGALYVAGGRLDCCGNSNVAAFDRYVLSEDSWETLPDQPTARSGNGAAALGSVIYSLGGETGRIVYDESEAYDIDAGEWSASVALPRGLHGIAVAAVGQQLFVIGGGPKAGFAQTSEVYVIQPRPAGHPPGPPAPSTAFPTPAPTSSPTPAPTSSPTPALTSSPTPAPTSFPTPAPTSSPTPAPTAAPTAAATSSPTPAPTAAPTAAATSAARRLPAAPILALLLALGGLSL